MLVYISFLVKKMKVDELIVFGGVFFLVYSLFLFFEIIDEMIRLYYEVYVLGLIFFFEM